MSESARITAIDPPATFRSFAAPRTHNAALVDPPLSQAGSLIDGNRALAASWDIEIGGLPIPQLRKTAREEVLRAAVHYVCSYRSCDWLGDDLERLVERPMVMGGHQPELFHPGVWFKNFALSRLAQQHDAVAVNLVVDNDLAGAAAIRCPVMSAAAAKPKSFAGAAADGFAGQLSRRPVAYDGPAALAVPYEQRWISEPDLFASFPERMGATLKGLVDEPLVHRLWPHAISASQRCSNLGCSLAQARHALEEELGLRTLELPFSTVSRTRGFSAFVLSLLTQLPRFQACYNDSLLEYRRAHSIRSSAHPVPALSEEDGWLEAPFWIYGDDDGRRRGAWARMSGSSLEISDRAKRLVRIDRPEADGAIEQLVAAQGATFKLRPRALTTTMFSRLILSDLFLHGIGGAKYDQLNDRIIERFFGIRAPEYCVLSATVLLPGWEQVVESLGHFASSLQLARQLRDIRFSPELFEGRVSLPQDLLDRKRELLLTIPPQGEKSAWHREMVEVNRQLAEGLDGVAVSLRREISGALAGESEQKLWRWREYAFPIFPLAYVSDALESSLDFRMAGRR